MENNLGLLTAFYKKNFNTIKQKMTKRAGTEWDAEDALQDAFERAIKYYNSYDPEKSTFAVWFSRILSNAVKDHLRRSKGLGDCEFDEEIADGTPCEQYTERMAENIRSAILSRKPHISEVLDLFFNKGYTARDISRLVELSHIAINQHIYRFREEIRKEYAYGGGLCA